MREPEPPTKTAQLGIPWERVGQDSQFKNHSATPRSGTLPPPSSELASGKPRSRNSWRGSATRNSRRTSRRNCGRSSRSERPAFPRSVIKRLRVTFISVGVGDHQEPSRRGKPRGETAFPRLLRLFRVFRDFSLSAAGIKSCDERNTATELIR